MAKDSTLSATDYRTLLRDVKKLVAQSKRRAADQKLDAYWTIGQHITEQRLSSNSGYLTSVLADLATDVRLARRTLYDAVQFFETHSAPPKDPELNWSHHRLLLRLPSSKDRDFYIKKIKQEHWSARQLEAAMAAGLHEGKPSKSLLDRPTDQSYVYSCRVISVIDGDTLDLDIDLGFGVARKLRARLADIQAPELSEPKGRAVRDFVTQQLMTAHTCVVKTMRVDLHGRYVVHFFFTRGVATITSCFTHGTYLNDLLIQNKHASILPS